MRFAVLADEGFGSGIGEVLDALLGTEVEFDPATLVLRVDEAEVCEPKPCMWR